MYQSQDRPQTGRGLRQQKNHSAADHKPTDSASLFLKFFSLRCGRAGTAGVALLSACIITVLSGCGVVYSGKSSLTGASGSTTGASLAQVSCGTQSLTGAQTKACSVYLSAAATSSAVVNLKSSNAALTVPAAVTVSAGAKTTGFNAVASSVTKQIAVTITASNAGVTKSIAITIYPAATTGPTTPGLSKISCGTQSLTGPTTKGCSVYLTEVASSPTLVQLSSNSSSLTVPPAVTVAAGNSTAGFGATALAVSASQTVTLTASYNGSSVTDAIQLVGSSGSTPTTQHTVKLDWNAPASSVAGYRVYRSSAGSSSFQLLNSTLDTQTSYSDSTVVSGESYEYEVKSVNSTGVESSPSNTTTVTIP